MDNNYFAELNAINVTGKTEKKNGLTYLSWVWAWGELKKLYPDATYTIYHNRDDWNYFTDGRTCWVRTGVTVNGIEHIEELPIMDNRNKAIPLDAVSSTDVNKTIQRSLTKAIARHGLGLYIYAGEDLPEEAKGEQPAAPAKTIYVCSNCKKPITDYTAANGVTLTAEEIAEHSMAEHGVYLCTTCLKQRNKANADS